MYLIIWRYQIHIQHRHAFETAYRPDGDWPRLFNNFDGYIRTELLHDTSVDEYLTIDYWRDADSYARFRSADRRAYEELDVKCDAFTAAETFIGAFSRERSDANW